MSGKRKSGRPGRRGLVWGALVLVIVAAVALAFFARRRSSTLPVPGRALEPSPQEEIRPAEKEALDRVLRERRH